jgi:hypothetical protein
MPTHPTMPDPDQATIAAAVQDGIARAIAVAGLAGVALIHLLDAPDTFSSQPYKGLALRRPHSRLPRDGNGARPRQ